MFNNLYVKQFPREDFTSEDLAVRDFEFTMQATFSKYGEILSATVMHNQEGKSLGFGFVCYKDPISA